MKKNPYRIARAAVTMTFASFLLGACSGPKAPATQAIPSTELAAADTPKPDYPIELACAGISGTTVLAVTIGVHGKPTQVTWSKAAAMKGWTKQRWIACPRGSSSQLPAMASRCRRPSRFR